MHQISFVGMGYVGLCTGVCFASKRYETILSDTDKVKVDSVSKGVSPFYEPNLEKMLLEAVNKGCLKATLGREEAISRSNITFITVGTPSKPDGDIDLRFVRSAAEEVGSALKKKESHHLVVIKSTVIPGTTESVVKPLLERRSGKQCGIDFSLCVNPEFGIDFSLCVNPEFLREGSAIHDTLNPDRIIIGEHDKKSGDILEDLYLEFYGDKMPPMVRANIPTAELVKYANNAFLATKISFINQIANICEKIPEVDVKTVAKGIGLDKRIGRLFLNAGLGYGGSCLPKDVQALIAFSRALGYDPMFIKSVKEVNEAQPYKAVELAKRTLSDLEGRRIAILGLAFKPNTDDIRESVSIKIIDKLLEGGANVVAYDPAAMNNTKKLLGNHIDYASSAIECIKGADCCIVATEWDEFKQLKPDDFIHHMKTYIVVDGRRIYDPEEYSRKVKFTAIGLGQ